MNRTMETPGTRNLNLRMRCCLALLTLFAAAVMATATVAQAQEQDSREGRKPPSPDQVVDMLSSRLNLSDDQKAQIKPIIADRQQSMQTLRSDTSMKPAEKKRKMKSIYEESDKKIEAILKDDQKKQYAELQQQMREHMKEHMRNRGSSD